MERRNLLLAGVATVGLNACQGVDTALRIAADLPAEIKMAVDDVKLIVAKVEPIAATVSDVAQIVVKVKTAISNMSSSNAVSTLAIVATWMAPLVSLASPLGGTVTRAIATLLPLIGGSRVSARTGMSPEQARMVLR